MRGACTGVSAAASGLVLALGLKMGKTIRETPWQIGVGVVAFVAIGVARQPLFWVLAALAPVSLALQLVEARVRSPALFELALQFLALSLLSIGGANAIIPEIHLRAVDIDALDDRRRLPQMFALAQAAPGPNVLIVSLVGWKAAGSPARSSRCCACARLRRCSPISSRTCGALREAPLRIASSAR